MRVLLMLFVVVVACAQQPEADLTRDEFEDRIFGEATQQKALEEDELVRQCMVGQGFEYLPTQMIGESNDPLPGVQDEDERIAQIGSGLVAGAMGRLETLESETAQPDESEESEEPQSEQFYEALTDAVVLDGVEVEGGCVAWAQQEYVELHPELTLQAEIAEAYSQTMADALTSARMEVVNAEWADCMALAGFDGLMELGDQYTLINERIRQSMEAESVSAQQRELEVALAFDIEISLANLECVQEVDEVRTSILADRFARFVEENRVSIEDWVQATD